MNTAVAPVLVASCGNELLADDAFGPVVAREVRAMWRPGIEVVDLGMRPASLLDHLRGRRAVIIVDAALTGPRENREDEEGREDLIDVDFFSDARPPLAHDRDLSSHGLSILHELELARRLGMLPGTVRLIAAPVRRSEPGQPMSTDVASLVRPAAERIARWARVWSEYPGEAIHA